MRRHVRQWKGRGSAGAAPAPELGGGIARVGVAAPGGRGLRRSAPAGPPGARRRASRPRPRGCGRRRGGRAGRRGTSPRAAGPRPEAPGDSRPGAGASRAATRVARSASRTWASASRESAGRAWTSLVGTGYPRRLHQADGWRREGGGRLAGARPVAAPARAMFRLTPRRRGGIMPAVSSTPARDRGREPRDPRAHGRRRSGSGRLRPGRRRARSAPTVSSCTPGPPIAWAAMCPPLRGAIVGALRYEGWAATDAEAERLGGGGRACASSPATATGRWAR